ncbi:MAG: EpsG family protein [Duncaniella sp.]|nr:EpsG family protein [Duncaniella sp.]
MIYFLNLIYSVVDTYIIGNIIPRRKLTDGAYWFLFAPVIIVWLIICGGQDNVGTDYPSYIELFHGQSLDRYEPGFVFIIGFCRYFHIEGQAIYFVFYALGFFFLGLILRRIDTKYLFLFILLYITMTGLFNNQLNILRQIIATYIGTYGALAIIDHRYFRGVIFILFASSIHFCALLFLGFLFTGQLHFITIRSLYICFAISLVLSFLISPSLINHLDFLIPQTYIKFITASAIEERSILLKITKYIFVPVYLIALSKFQSLNLTSNEISLFKYGFLAFCLKMTLLNLTIISRLFDIFLIFSIFPIFYYLRNLDKRSKTAFTVLVCFFVCIYGAKVLLFPSAEYLYQSIYSKFVI